jgi:hypothetical protein
MASTYSSSLRLELMATGDQSGTWGDTTNTNLGTLLEQAITGVLSVAQGDVANLTLTTVNGGSDQARNAVVNVTGALTAQRNVVVQTANKLYLIKNSTTGGFSIVAKTASGTGVTIVNGTSQWVYSDGTNVVQGLAGTMASQAASAVAITGGTIAGLTSLDLATAGTITFNTNNWVATHTSGILTVGTGDLRVTTAGTNTASVVTVGGTQTLTNKTLTTPVFSGTPTGLDASTTAKGISEFATAAEFRTGTDTARSLVVDQTWAAAAWVSIGASLTGNLTIDFATAINFYGTATGNITFNAVSNAKDQSGEFMITASGGDRTVSFNTTPFATPNNASLGTITSGTTMLFSYTRAQNGKFVISAIGTVS